MTLGCVLIGRGKGEANIKSNSVFIGICQKKIELLMQVVFA
jgi:hypothetical protein